jgi:hypothetical protein
MRISMNEASPHYITRPHLYEVFVDGLKITHCIEACEETGRAWIMKKNDAGIALTVLKGVVKIVKIEC